MNALVVAQSIKLQFPNMLVVPENNSKHFTVLIIGGGVAGCSAAKTLVENGFSDVMILEAQHYVGGRVRTTIVDGAPMEWGAQWLHGDIGNPIYDIVQDKQLVAWNGSHSKGLQHYPGTAWLIDKLRGTPAQRRKIIKEASKALMVIYDKIISLHAKQLDGSTKLPLEHDSFGKLLREEFVKRVAAGTNENKTKLQMAVLDWRMRYEGVDNATLGMDRLSIRYSNRYILNSDKDMDWVKGTSSFLESVLVPPIQGKITLNKPVATVNWTDSPVKVVCKDGEVITADVVLVTCSIGYLQRELDSFFVPKLPVSKLEAIQSFGFGTTDKIFLRFDTPFWNDYCDGFNFLWIDEEHGPLDAELSVITGSSVLWWRSIVGFDTLTLQDNLLLGWIAGGAAEAMELCSDEQVLQVCWKLLCHFTRQPLERPSHMFRTRWGLEPYVRGSYSYIPSGFTWSAFEDMISPVSHLEKPRIFFAGEALHPGFYSTLHGAYETGVKQAKAILQLCQLDRHVQSE